MATVTSDSYLIVIERTATNLSAFSPDLPGCVATGANRAEVQTRMTEAIRMHLNGLREDGLPIPKPSSEVGYVSITDDEAEPRDAPESSS